MLAADVHLTPAVSPLPRPGLPDSPGKVVFGNVSLPKQKKRYNPPDADYCYLEEAEAGPTPSRKAAPGGVVAARAPVASSTGSTWRTLLFVQAAAALVVAWLRYRHTHRAGASPARARVVGI